MPDTRYAKLGRRLAAVPSGYAMISCSPGHGADLHFAVRVAVRSTPMMGTDRSTLCCRAVLFFFVTLGIPAIARPANLEDSAKEFARKIAAALPSGQSVSVEIGNVSSLRPDEVSRMEVALKAELQVRGARLTEPGDATATVIVTLSESRKEFVWTGEIRRADASHTILMAVSRAVPKHPAPNAMHVTVRSEKFWEGPERILDAAEAANGAGRSWLVLLLPSNLTIQDLQTGTAARVDIPPPQSISRDPWGRLGVALTSSTIWFVADSGVCKMDLETRTAPECLPKAEADRPGSWFPMTIEVRPAGPPPPGKGLELIISPVCGATEQFLATSARDYTQPDSLQVYQTESSGPVAISGELDFAGPILALHADSDVPRAIVHNLTTGNYEAYRLDISCGQ